MKKLIFLLLFPLLVFSQQVNHTWGYTTAGTAYTQTGSINIDSTSTTSIVFDMQDYAYVDYNPIASDDSVIIGSSTRMYFGTFWYKTDVQNATDSSAVRIVAYSGFMDYYPGTGDRIATANIDYSTSGTTLQDSTTYTTNDVQWTAVNVYLATTKILPPEFIKLVVTWGTFSNDSIDFYHDFAYLAIPQEQQERRTTTNQGNAKKDPRSMH